ncbi:DUF3891 family protein [Acidicapsa ligni]|uniref:DUF3891 family protein n=1 Tax=Acidicapsa ligni TaxID=542300 RepID=UPI0021E08D35|nr:DUF3891 family protein [Acidicapsa ligni]
MLRMETDTGWWLITHPDHARLAGEFARAWGNSRFRKPEPRMQVLHGIATHDDGWVVRDQHPSITRQGKPSAFSIELVGKYSAFEEIDLSDYLAVRERAVRIVAAKDPYAGLLIAMHTYNLLTDHADRSTIASDQLPLLDEFLDKQLVYQQELLVRIDSDPELIEQEKDRQTIEEHFHLLQACDNLSLLACVAYASPATLLHPLPLNDGSESGVAVIAIAPRKFRLEPWPFAEELLTFNFPARHVEGLIFANSAVLDAAFAAAPVQMLTVTLSA